VTEFQVHGWVERECVMSVFSPPLQLPELLQEQISAARETGFYTSEEELVADAVRILLAARPDVRLATACRLYERGTVSLGKAAELAGLDIESLKRALDERGIVRTAPESVDEIKEMARTSLQAAARTE
jgi:predicted HTH domain antitoxin